ncbi:MAG: hypothetical protein SA339_05945 [Methanomassiliicoccus sp.]|nr:hypothetical protein [Methanomassiliicoccus sp.]
MQLSVVSDAWSEADYYQTGVGYAVELTATYQGNAESGFNYYIMIHETSTGEMSSDDFTITGTTGDAPGVNLNLEQTVPGTWISTPVMVSAGAASNSVHVIITPGASASGLSDVSFEIDAVSELPLK